MGIALRCTCTLASPGYASAEKSFNGIWTGGPGDQYIVMQCQSMSWAFPETQKYIVLLQNYAEYLQDQQSSAPPPSDVDSTSKFTTRVGSGGLGAAANF